MSDICKDPHHLGQCSRMVCRASMAQYGCPCILGAAHCICAVSFQEQNVPKNKALKKLKSDHGMLRDQVAHVRALATLRGPGSFVESYQRESGNAHAHLLTLLQLRPSLSLRALVLLSQVCSCLPLLPILYFCFCSWALLK